jgi:hypothetical protein
MNTPYSKNRTMKSPVKMPSPRKFLLSCRVTHLRYSGKQRRFWFKRNGEEQTLSYTEAYHQMVLCYLRLFLLPSGYIYSFTSKISTHEL